MQGVGLLHGPRAALAEFAQHLPFVSRQQRGEVGGGVVEGAGGECGLPAGGGLAQGFLLVGELAFQLLHAAAEGGEFLRVSGVGGTGGIKSGAGGGDVGVDFDPRLGKRLIFSEIPG